MLLGKPFLKHFIFPFATFAIKVYKLFLIIFQILEIIITKSCCELNYVK